MEIQRIPAPVPNYESKETDGSWHYFRPDEITEDQKLNGVSKPDIFCPIVQLQRLVDYQGEPNVVVNSNFERVSVKDKNDKWEKIANELDDFCEKYTGLDLSPVVRKEALQRNCMSER